jgi:hypothetical protein
LEKTFSKIKETEEKADQAIAEIKLDLEQQKEMLLKELEEKKKNLLIEEKKLLEEAISREESSAKSEIDSIVKKNEMNLALRGYVGWQCVHEDYVEEVNFLYNQLEKL